MRTSSISSHRASRRSAFTLIELLVVIGIISVLIGILVPTLSHARESARRTQCLANLRGLAQAMILYADDYQGRLPNSNPKNTAYDYDSINSVLVSLAKRYVEAPSLFHCPSDSDDVQTEIITADYVLPNSARESYDFYSVFWVPEHGPKLTKIKDAPLAWDLSGASTPSKDQNHGPRGGNVVFADGHADWQDSKQWDGPNWPSPAARYYN